LTCQNLLPSGLASNISAARRLGPEGGWSPLLGPGKELLDDFLKLSGGNIPAFRLN